MAYDPIRRAKWRQELIDRGECVDHPGVMAADGHTICKDCLNRMADARKKRIAEGMCQNHPRVPAAPGLKSCQGCIDRLSQDRKELIAQGLCYVHSEELLVPGKTMCQICLDMKSISKLPESARAADRVRAKETLASRLNGTYKCPVWGLTESELNVLFPIDSSHSVWAFDHSGDNFRDIISRRANHALGNLTPEQLHQAAGYAEKHRVS